MGIKCKELIKQNCNVYMIDEDGYKLDLENDLIIQKYQKKNNVKVIDMVNEFLNTQDDKFYSIISTIERMVKKYNIDYFMYGDAKRATNDRLSLMYNLKNRNSYIDCNFKISYYCGRRTNERKVSYMIDFFKGSDGDYLGFSFYRYFNFEDFYKIEIMLDKYFSSDMSGTEDKEVLNNCIKNVQSGINYYYS